MPVKNQSIQFNRVAKLSGNWNNGDKAGSFYLNVNNTPSNRNRNISEQLAHVRIKTGIIPLF